MFITTLSLYDFFEFVLLKAGRDGSVGEQEGGKRQAGRGEVGTIQPEPRRCRHLQHHQRRGQQQI